MKMTVQRKQMRINWKKEDDDEEENIDKDIRRRWKYTDEKDEEENIMWRRNTKIWIIIQEKKDEERWRGKNLALANEDEQENV